VSRFLNLGWRVLGIDDFSSSSMISRHHVELLKNENYMFNKMSIDNDTFYGTYKYEIGKIDLILNFACPASPPKYQALPLKTMDTCYTGTKNVLELAKTLGCRVIHASTSEVYGDPVSSPQAESDWGNVNCFGPRSCYDEGKRVAETLVFEFQKRDVDVRMIRIFNTYGTNMDPFDGRVVTNFIRQALNDENITMYGDGSQSRSFCYIDDLVNGIVSLSQIESGDVKRPINLGNATEFTMYELANLVLKLIPESKSQMVFELLPIDDPRQRRPDLSKAKQLLGYETKFSLEEGLIRTIAYIRSLKSGL